MKRVYKILSVVLAIVMVMGMVTGCGSSQAQDTDGAENAPAAEESTKSLKTKLAVCLPLTGNNMQYGVSYRNAITMAVDEFNEAGGVNGQSVTVEFYDDKGDQKEGLNAANKIVSDPEVFAAIGSFGSSLSMAITPVFEEAQVPLISPNTSHPDYPTMSTMGISISQTAEFEQKSCAEMVSEKFNNASVAFLYQNTDHGVSACENFTKYYEACGGKVVATETFLPGQTKDFTPLLSKIKATNPEILYVSADYTDCAQALLQCEKVGLTAQFVAPGMVVKQEFLDIVGTKCDGTVLVSGDAVYLPEVIAKSNYKQSVIDFINGYNERYPETSCDGFAAGAYDAARLLLSALSEVGDDPMAIVDYVHSLPIDMVSAVNPRFDGAAYCKDIYFYTIEDGAFRNLE